MVFVRARTESHGLGAITDQIIMYSDCPVPLGKRVAVRTIIVPAEVFEGLL